MTKKGLQYFYYKYLRKKAFQDTFKALLFNTKLNHGARLLGLALLTVPPQSQVKLKKLARKLGSHAPAVSNWKKELEKANCMPRSIEPIEITKK